jgi:hypothetical protein
MYRLIKDDEERIKWLIEVEFDAGFEGDTGNGSTLDTLMEDVRYEFFKISDQIKSEEVECPECGQEMSRVREYLDGEETGNWYEICDECGYSDFGEHKLATLERRMKLQKELKGEHIMDHERQTKGFEGIYCHECHNETYYVGVRDDDLVITCSECGWGFELAPDPEKGE